MQEQRRVQLYFEMYMHLSVLDMVHKNYGFPVVSTDMHTKHPYIHTYIHTYLSLAS